MQLYWVTTPDGYENWFAVAKSKKIAETFHENAEGFNPNYTTAKLVCKIPKNLVSKYMLYEEGWPSHKLIKELGGKITSENNPRIVNFDGKIYTEGAFNEELFFEYRECKPGVYIVKIQNTDKYKIGRTKNLKARLKQFATGNPDNIKIVYFVETGHYLSLEKHLHEIFKNDRIKGEWFLFDDKKLAEAGANLYLLQSKAPKEFRVFNLVKVSK